MDSKSYGFDWEAILGLLIIAGIFGAGNGFGFGNGYNGVSNEFIYDQLANDVRANGQAIATTDRDVLISSCNTDKEVMQSRYDTLLAFGNQTQLMQSCCCDIKNAIHAEGEETRALITANRIADLEKELSQAQGIIANTAQTQNILNSLGNYYPKTGVNPAYVYSYPYGTTIV